MRFLQNSTFEKIIEDLFIKNGYTKVRNNYYDGSGGDVDLVFKAFNTGSLMYDIFKMYDDDISPEIYIQAKKKNGKDLNDIDGINQLIQIAQKDNKPKVLILINLTDDFTLDAKALAEQFGVVLLNGKAFASLLLRHGLEDVISLV